MWFHVPLPRTAQIFLPQLQKLSTEMGHKIILNAAMRKSTGFPAKTLLESCRHLELVQLSSTSLLHRTVQDEARGQNNDIIMWLFTE